MAETEPDPERIEQDLAQTRARIDDRLSDLEERLSPKQLLNEGLATLSGSDGGDFARDMLARARANPLPVLLTGLGVAWWVLSEKSGDEARPSRYGMRQSGEGAGRAGLSRPAVSAAPPPRTAPAVLALGALGAVVGAVLAVTIPTTRYEKRTLGSFA
jgi:hypothetical protein